MKRFMALTMSLTLFAGLGCDKKSATDAPGGAGRTARRGGGGRRAPPPPAGKETPPTKEAPAATPPPAEAKPKFADTTPIWALAPADATYGVVLADGVGARVLDLIATQRKKLEGKP